MADWFDLLTYLINWNRIATTTGNSAGADQTAQQFRRDPGEKTTKAAEGTMQIQSLNNSL